MCVLNGIDRFSLVGEVVDRLPAYASRAGYAKQAIRDALVEHRSTSPGTAKTIRGF